MWPPDVCAQRRCGGGIGASPTPFRRPSAARRGGSELDKRALSWTSRGRCARFSSSEPPYGARVSSGHRPPGAAAAAAAAMASFGTLPDDVLALVLSKLGRRDAAQSSLACKSWRTLSAVHRRALRRRFFDRHEETISHLRKWFERRNFTALNDAFRSHDVLAGQAHRLGQRIAAQMHPLPAEAPAVVRRLVRCGFDPSRMNGSVAFGGVFTHACRLWNRYGQDPEQEPLRRDIATILLQHNADADFQEFAIGIRRNIHENPPAIFWLMCEPAWLSVLLSETRKSTILADLNVRLGRYDPGPSGAGWRRGRDMEGEMTPLMWLAVGRGLGATFISEPKAVECASLLLNAYNDCYKGLRANPTLQDGAGRTAASMARSRERHRLAEVLEEACERWVLEPPRSP